MANENLNNDWNGDKALQDYSHGLTVKTICIGIIGAIVIALIILAI